jgi:DNA-binding transcriptional ArsR family regulator
MTFRALIFAAAAPLAAASLPLAGPAACAATGLSSSVVAGLANMSQELTGPHPPYMLIYYALIEKIKSGELKPGDRVPSVTELVQAYNVSHSTARRALAKLKDQGLTDTVPGYATFVRFTSQDGPS